MTALPLVGLLVAGQILVERIFAYNGMGKLIYDAILDQDFPVIQGSSYIIILMTALSVFLVDLLYPFIDPRIERGGRVMTRAAHRTGNRGNPPARKRMRRFDDPWLAPNL